MPVVYVDQGPKAKFGPLKITGNDKIYEQYVLNRITWKQGDVYDQSKVDNVRRTLIESRLYKGVELVHPGKIDERGELPLELRLQEAKFRTFEAGLGFNMDESFKGKLAWEHRNITGRADALRTEISRSNKELKGGLQYRLPDIFSPKNTFVANVDLQEEEGDAYKSISTGGSTIIEHKFGNGYFVSGGVSAEAGRSSRLNIRHTYQLLGAPMYFALRRVANPLDPTKGFKTEIGVHPQVGHIGDRDYFVTTRLAQTFYLPLDKTRKIVMATWGKANFITGGNRITLPANKLLYAGGAGSVRGYRHQRLGPLDSVGKPLGGRSSVQVGVEGRIKVHPKWSIVPFYEGANVRESPMPNLRQNFLWGYGVGARYHLDFAPIRFDVAFPQKVRRVNGRRRDSLVNVYFSIGQAF